MFKVFDFDMELVGVEGVVEDLDPRVGVDATDLDLKVDGVDEVFEVVALFLRILTDIMLLGGNGGGPWPSGLGGLGGGPRFLRPLGGLGGWLSPMELLCPTFELIVSVKEDTHHDRDVEACG